MEKNKKRWGKQKIKILIFIILIVSLSLYLNFDNFIESLRKSLNGIGFLDSFKEFKIEIDFWQKIKDIFVIENFGNFFTKNIIPLIMISSIYSIFVFYVVSFYKSRVYEIKIFATPEKKEKYDKRIINRIIRFFLKSIFFIKDMFFRYPILFLKWYFNRSYYDVKKKENIKKWKKELTIIALIILFVKGYLFLIVVDLLKIIFLPLIFSLTSNPEALRQLSLGIIGFSKYLAYKSINGISIFKLIIITIIGYIIMSVALAELSIKKMYDRIKKFVLKLSSILIIITGPPGSGKTSTNVALVRASELAAFEFLESDRNNIEIQFKDVIDFKKLEENLLTAAKIGVVKTIQEYIDYVNNYVKDNYGRAVFNNVYNDLSPHGKLFKDEIVKYSQATYQLMQETIIKSNIPIEGSGINPFRKRFLAMYGRETYKPFIPHRILTSKRLNMDNFKDPDMSISGKLVRSLNPGDQIFITEADKEWNAFNQSEVMRWGVAHRLGIIRHVISYGKHSIGKIFMDYQTDSALARQIRTKAESFIQIMDYKMGTFLMLSPVKKFTNWRLEKNKEKRNKLKWRSDINVHAKRIEIKVSNWLMIDNFFNRYKRRIIKGNVVDDSGKILRKFTLGIPICSLSRYNGTHLADIERLMSSANTHIPLQFNNGLDMSPEDIAEIKSIALTKMYLHNDIYGHLIVNDNYDFLKKESENKSDNGKKVYSEEEKYERYLNRSVDESLTDRERKYAKNWVKKYEEGRNED